MLVTTPASPIITLKINNMEQLKQFSNLHWLNERIVCDRKSDFSGSLFELRHSINCVGYVPRTLCSILLVFKSKSYMTENV